MEKAVYQAQKAMSSKPQAALILKRRINERTTTLKEKRVNKEDNDHQLMGEAKTAMHDMTDMLVNYSTSDQLSFEDRIAMLNANQRRMSDIVNSHLHHQKQHKTGECQCDFKPLRMFVSGVGLTGESLLVEASSW